MLHHSLGLLALAALTALSLASAPAGDSPSPYVLDHTVKRIDGTEESLETYKGKVILIVNTASECGLTPQYKGLEALYRAHKERGLVVLGFPANNFAGQEPGTNKEIARFCEDRFDVTFPMFEKISVKGDDIHPLYKQIDAQPDPIGELPTWNFTKYLVDREGNVVARFDPRTGPDEEKLTARIEELLAEG